MNASMAYICEKFSKYLSIVRIAESAENTEDTENVIVIRTLPFARDG